MLPAPCTYILADAQQKYLSKQLVRTRFRSNFPAVHSQRGPASTAAVYQAFVNARTLSTTRVVHIVGLAEPGGQLSVHQANSRALH